MKKLILFIVVATTLTTISCSSDDNSSKTVVPEGYPTQINKVDFTGKTVGDEVTLTGKGFNENELGAYKITFVKKLPQTNTTSNITVRAPKPDESNGNVEAMIIKVTDTTVLFSVPADAGNGSVKFVYKKYETPIGNYQR
ncbi:MAG: hypothetical protein ACRCVU_15790 [Flavobacterium sp.]